MKKCTILLITIVAMIYAIATPIAGCFVSDGKKEWNTDGWEDIKDINDKHIQEIGSWAVSEYPKWVDPIQCRLQFRKVVSGKEKKVMSDLKYELIIDASDISGELGKYNAQVYEQGLTNTPKLICFTKAS